MFYDRWINLGCIFELVVEDQLELIEIAGEFFNFAVVDDDGVYCVRHD